MHREQDMDMDVDVDSETLRSACGDKRNKRACERRTRGPPRQGGYVSRRATPTGASVAARATCELVRAYTDAKLACGVWEGGVVSRGNPTYPHNDQFR